MKAESIPVNPAPYPKKVNALVVAARVSFPAFVLLVHPAESGYIYGELHRYLAHLVQNMVDGFAGKRITVSVPPQHGKSSLLTVLAGAWLVGKYPGIAVGLTGALGSLLNDFSKRVRAIVNSQQYQWAFPGVVPLFGSNRSDSWSLTNGSSVVARPAGSKLTGRRVDFLIIDDPHRGREDAESPLMRARVREWYFADCYTRLSPEAKVLIVATRWHPEDLIGHLTSEAYKKEMRLRGQEQEIYQRFIIEALCEHPERDPLRRGLGAPLCPELGRGVPFLEATRAALPGYEWSSQYQGDPRPRLGDVADVTKFIRMPMSSVPVKDVEWLRGWDLALTEKEASDFSAGTLCGIDRTTGLFYIAHIQREKKAWGRLKPMIVDLARGDLEQYNAARMAVEVVGGFEIGWAELRSALLDQVKVSKVTSSKSKMVRAQPWLNKLDTGKCVLVEGPWNKDFVDELAAFPAGAHDDMVDGVSVAWHALHRPSLLVA